MAFVVLLLEDLVLPSQQNQVLAIGWVDGLESEGTAGRLAGTDVFLFRGNCIAEKTYYKGASASRLIHQEVLRLQKLEGMDRLSRGNLAEGVMAGEGMKSFIPLHKSASQVLPTLIDQVRSWVRQDLITLEPDDWFEQGHNIAGGYKDSNGT
eukprot:9447974-Ditylum_brightwellii.AAC.1